MDRESGFTLVELLIVVLIIGILATVAIPVFNGQRAKAKNAAAKSAVRNSMSAMSSYWVGNGESFLGFDLLSEERSFTSFEDITSAGATPPGAAGDPRVAYGYIFRSGTSAANYRYPYAAVCVRSKGTENYCAIAGDLRDVYPTPKNFEILYGKSTTTVSAAHSNASNGLGW